MKPKIAILTLHPSNGGGVLSVLKEVYKYCSYYFEPTVFSLGFTKDISAYLSDLKFDSRIRSYNYQGMNCVEVGSRYAFWEPGHYKFTLKQWAGVLKEYKYFFVCGGPVSPAHPLVLLKKPFFMWVAPSYDDDKKNRIKELHGLRKYIDIAATVSMRKIELDILNKAGVVLAQSKYSRDMFNNMLVAPKVQYCPYPIEVKEIYGSGKKAIVAVGRFDDPRKNVEMLLRVFRLIQVDELIIVGPKPSEEKLRGLSLEGIVFVGKVSSEELNKIYSKATLMLITSYQEGLGIIGLEAMSCGIPVISTDCGGTSDYVVDGHNGFIVPIDSDQLMADKANLLLSDFELYFQFSQNAREYVKVNHSHKLVYSIFQESMTKVYPELQNTFVVYRESNECFSN